VIDQALLFQAGAKECLLYVQDTEGDEDSRQRINDVFEKCGVVMIETKKGLHLLL
jgi:hypothetical protein